MPWPTTRSPARWFIVALLAVTCLACDGGQDRPPPDILLITIDTLRADRVGCYGYETAATPVMDRLAAEGIRYEYCQAAVPITLPSHAALLTGKLPASLGVRNNGTYRLGQDPTLLAEVLGGRGFATGAFVAAFPLASRFGLARGFDHYDDRIPDRGASQFDYPERPGTVVVAAALEWLAGQDSRRPVFLWVHLFEPHLPYAPPAPFDRSFVDNPYDGEVAAADAAVGQLLAGFSRIREEAPLTVLTSDHGEGLGQHQEPTHALFLFESTLRVPLILHAPGRVPAGEVVSEPVGLIDVAPTILALAGIREPTFNPDGVAVGPGHSPPRRDLIAETLAGFECCGWSPAFSLRHGEHKVVLSARPLAFDLASDPTEQDNRWSGERPVWAEQLQDRLEAHVALLESQADDEETTRRLTTDERRKLEALGYLTGGSQPAGFADRGGLLRAMAELPDATERRQAFAAVTQAQKLVARSEYDQAITLVTPILAGNPRNSDARSLLAGCLAKLGRLDEAIAEFTLLTEQLPRHLEPRFNLADLLRRTGNYQAAAEHYTVALRLDPENLTVLKQAIPLLVNLRRFDPVLESLGRVEARSDLAEADRAFMHEAFARVHLARGEPERGEPHLARLRAWRDGPQLVVLAARFAAARGDWARVRELLTGTGSDGIRSLATRVLLARAEGELGNRQAAVLALGALLSENEGWAAAHDALANVLAADGNLAEAEVHARRALTLDPRTPDFHLTYLELLQLQGRDGDARSHAASISNRFGKHVGILKAVADLVRD